VAIDADFPNRMFFATSLGDVAFNLGINADHAWAISPQGVQDVPIEQARAVTGLLQPVKGVSSDAKNEVTGIEQIDGRPYLRVVSTTAGSMKRLYFDKQSGLLYKVHTEYPTPLGPEPVDTTFEDYADVNGIQMPFSITNLPVTDRVVYRFSKIEMNVAVDPSKFDPPPAKK
jgi:hypothetical protein